MKVYLVRAHYDYEGAVVRHVASSIEKAVAWIKAHDKVGDRTDVLPVAVDGDTEPDEISGGLDWPDELREYL